MHRLRRLILSLTIALILAPFSTSVSHAQYQPDLVVEGELAPTPTPKTPSVSPEKPVPTETPDASRSSTSKEPSIAPERSQSISPSTPIKAPASGSPSKWPEPPQETASERQARQDDTIYLGFSTFFYKTVGLGIGGQIAYYLNPDLLLELGAYVGISALPELQEAGVIGAGLRAFITDSLYVRGGISYRKYYTDDWMADAVEAVIEAAFNLDKRDDKFVYIRDIGVDIAIGNRWQWAWFTIGIDWIGLYLPINILEVEARVVDSKTQKVLFRETLGQGKATQNTDARFLNVQVGVSF